MSTETGTARARVDASPRSLGLLVGDLLAIGTFVVAGEISHGIDPVAKPVLVADTFAPFCIGWLLVGVVAGAYAPGVERSLRTTLLTVGPAWVGAVVLAQALRATEYFHGDAAVTFALVSLAVGGVLLVGWRLVLAAVTTRSARG